jgi:hypothetical protein
MHGAAKAPAHEDGQIARVIEVRVTEDDGVQPARNEGRRLPVATAQLLAALEQPTIE